MTVKGNARGRVSLVAVGPSVQSDWKLRISSYVDQLFDGTMPGVSRLTAKAYYEPTWIGIAELLCDRERARFIRGLPALVSDMNRLREIELANKKIIQEHSKSDGIQICDLDPFLEIPDLEANDIDLNREVVRAPMAHIRPSISVALAPNMTEPMRRAGRHP